MNFAIGYEKNMSYLVVPKSPKVYKNVEKIRLSSFKSTWGFLIFRSFHFCCLYHMFGASHQTGDRNHTTVCTISS